MADHAQDRIKYYAVLFFESFRILPSHALHKGVIESKSTPPLINNLVLVGEMDGRDRISVGSSPADEVAIS